MSEIAHTPGPWTITRSKMATDGAFDYAISAGAVSVLAEAFGRDAHGGWPPAEANARLIAAAPDLLEALKKIAVLDTHLVWTGGSVPEPSHEEMGEIAKIAVTAIARAEGRS